jgi:hypothetical protein
MRRNTLLVAALAAVLMGAATLPKLSVQAKTDVGGKASGLVAFFGFGDPGDLNPLIFVPPDGSSSSFTLPTGSVLVVTDLVVSTNGPPAAGLTRGGLIAGGIGNTMPYFSFDATKQANQEIHLSSGRVWSVVPDLSVAADSANSVFVEVHGYLAKDK